MLSQSKPLNGSVNEMRKIKNFGFYSTKYIIEKVLMWRITYISMKTLLGSFYERMTFKP